MSSNPAPLSTGGFIDFHTLPPGTLLTAPQVSVGSGISCVTLSNWRSLKRGPKYIKVGMRMVRYRAGDVAAFFDAGAQDCRNTAAAEGGAA